MNPDEVTFDDILRMGGEKGRDFLIGIIARELSDHDKRIRALTSIRVNDYRRSKVNDLIKFLDYQKGGADD